MHPKSNGGAATPARPNILCIVSEDCPPRLGAYGDALAHTPNLDRLARGGIVFENAFCTSPVCAPSRFAILTGHYAETVGPAHQMSAVAHLPQSVRTYPELLREAGYYCTNNFKTHYNCDVDPDRIWDESSRTAHWSNRPEATPFLAVFNCMETHESRIFSPFDGAVRPDDVEVPSYLPDAPTIREELARYYNRIAVMDAYMGERLDELDRAGVAEDTIVLYFSDHGSPLPRSKRFCYDEGLRVPLIVRIPEKWRHLAPAPAGSRATAPVSLVDLLPSLLSVAGVGGYGNVQGTAFLGPDAAPRRYAFSGRDRMDERYDLMRTVRSERYRYIRNYAPHRIYGQHYAFAWNAQGYQAYERLHLDGRLNATQEKFWHRKPAEELYDLADDPDQTVNLVASPEHAEIVADMRAALDAHMLAIRDNGFIPESAPAEGYEASRNEILYPLERVMALAAKAIRHDPAHVPDFIDALGDGNEIVRFWAAQGLLMLAIEGVTLPNLRAAFEREESVHVRIVLAEAKGHAGDIEASVDYLTGAVRGARNVRIAVQAINALTYLPLRPDISLEVIEACADSEDEYVRGSAEYLRLLLKGEYRPDSKVFDYGRFDMTAHLTQAKPPVMS